MTHGTDKTAERRLQNPVEFNVLGPVTVADAAQSLNIGGPKQRTVLAMLIAHHGRPVSNDVIAEAVYGDDANSRNRRNVQTYVSTLRSIVGDVIVRQGSGWFLDVDRSQVDALAFEDLYESARSNGDVTPEASARLLREALALWRGHPYDDIESHGRLDAEIARLDELRVAAQAARIDADLESGRHADLIGEIEGHIVEHPYSERFRAQHMLALYRAGRQREALRSYEDMRTLLVDELGVDPTPELQDLEHRILEQDDSLVAAPRRQIQKKAILVADPGDPIELARLPMAERQELLSSVTAAMEKAVGAESGGRLLPAGVATYAVFDDITDAAAAAERATLRLDGSGLRMAIDYGDVEVTDDGVSGAPVSRSAVLVSVAHRGQVLLSADAQQAVVADGDGAGLRFESLGRHELVGIKDPVSVYQLLVGNPPATFPPLETDHLPVPLPDGGDRSVPGYELREPIGTGSIGTLYRAYQPSVGREVLVEVIGRADASDADFIRHFEADAQRLALLDHPNINPLLDYWRDVDGAYLVYRYHRGGFVERGTGDTVAQVGSALVYAHSYGVVHGSLRPDRIILDETGNAYLMGFPVGGVPPQSSTDYPAYIAPETLAGEPATVATDVYALGVLAHEIESGPVSSDAALAPISDVVARATAENPEERPGSVAELLEELLPKELDRPGTRFTASRNPYKGLAAFHESDAGDFFGRGSVVEELVTALTDGRFLAVVGPSGIGKSSVVRAGLIPSLRRGAIDGSSAWVITDMLPGPRPFLELGRALERIAIDLPPDVRERFAQRDSNALAGLSRVLPEGSELLLVIDQFEELFTMTDEEAASAFLDLLVNAATLNQARIVVTLRADFLDRPLLYSEFGELLRESMIGLRSPSIAELGEAIKGPAHGVGVDVDPALVERLVSEVHDRPGGLPLLQFALVELFDSRESDLLTVDAYEDVGGVVGSVARRAETVYEGLDIDQKSAIKQVFLRLVTVVDDSAPTRRRVRLADLDDLEAGTGIEAFARNRMLVFDNDPDTRAPTVEVAHEALLTQWPRLAGWIEATREDLTLSRRLDEAIRDWETSDGDDAYLLTGGRLAQHQAWTSGTSLILTDREAGYLEASTRRDGKLRTQRRRRRNWIMGGFAAAALVASIFGVAALREANRADEAAARAEQNAAHAEAETLAANAVAALASDPELALLLAVQASQTTASPATIAALHQSLQAERSIMVIQPPGKGELAMATLDPLGERVAVVGANTAEVEMWQVGADQPLWSITLSDDFNAAFRDWSHLWFSEDGETLYVPLSADGFTPVYSPDQGLYTIDAASGSVTDLLEFPCLTRAMPAGRHFASEGTLWALDWAGQASESGCDFYAGSPGAGVLDIATGEKLFQVELSPGRPPTLSENGRHFASSSEYLIDGVWQTRQRVYDITTGDIIFETDFDPSSSVLSKDGSRILVGQNPTYLYDVATQTRIQSYQGDFVRVFFSPDESRVIGTGQDGTRVFDTETGVELMHLTGQTSAPLHAAVDLDSQLLVSTATDAQVWDIAEPTRGELEPIELESIGSRFAPGGVATSDGYTLVHRGRINQATSNEPTPHLVETIRLSDGQTVKSQEVWWAAIAGDGVLFVQPVVETDVTTPSGAEGAVLIGAPRLVDLATGSTIRMLEDCDWYWIAEGVEPEPGMGCTDTVPPRYTAVSFSDDGDRVLGATGAGAMTIWEIVTGSVVRRLPRSWDPDWDLRNLWGSALSPDGSLMVHMFSEFEVEAYFDGTGEVPALHVVDVATGDRLAVTTGIDAWVNHLEFVPSAGLVIGIGNDLLVIDTDTWEVSSLTRPQGTLLNDVAVSPDGRLAATVGTDEFVAVWDLQSRSLIAEFPIVGWIGEGLRGIAFEDDTTLIVAPEAGDQLLRFSIDTDVLLERAFESLDRGFRAEECATYGIDPCPTLEEMRFGS